MTLSCCTRRLRPRPTISPSITSTDPIGMQPSSRPAVASATAASRKGSSTAGETTVSTVGYAHIDVEPVTNVLGAYVRGIDVREPLDDEVIRELSDAWVEH